MTDSIDDNSVDVGLSLDLIEEEIEAGLPMHADRLVRAYVNEEFYRCRNAAFIRPRISEEWEDFIRRPKRTSKLTRLVVKKLCQHLYAPGPQRKVGASPAADTLLASIYERNHFNALMSSADRKCTLNATAALGAVATGRPEKPIQLSIWGAHEFTAWGWPDDPTEAWAVCTINRERKIENGRVKERLRFEAFSAMEHRVYLCEWQNVPDERTYDLATASYRMLFGQTARFTPELSGYAGDDGSWQTGVNPYGCVPFTLISDETRTTGLFDAGGVGDPLRECNQELDRELSDLAAHVAEFMDPDRFFRNVEPGFRREKNRSRWQELKPGRAVLSGEGGVQPEAFLVQADLQVEQVLTENRAYADQTIEELDLPVAAVRNDASTDLSGIAIVAKQLPLLQRVKGRQQEPFTQHEHDAAAMILTVYGNFYGDAGVLAAAEDPQLALLWPEPTFPLPTPERDQEDEADLEAGRKSQVQIVAERNGCTPDQAKTQLLRVLDENAWYAAELKKRGMAQPDPLPPPGQGANEPSPNASGDDTEQESDSHAGDDTQDED